MFIINALINYVVILFKYNKYKVDKQRSKLKQLSIERMSTFIFSIIFHPFNGISEFYFLFFCFFKAVLVLPTGLGWQLECEYVIEWYIVKALG